MPTPQTVSLDTALDKGLQLTFPPVMVQLLQALLEPAPSFSSIAGFLKMDPMLAGKILHVVNSTSYSFEHRITDLQRAAIAIGTSDLFKLVISLSLQKKLHPSTSRNSELVFGDWRMTLWSAMSAEAIAEHLCPQQKPAAYLSGMLKDLPLFLAFCREDIPVHLQTGRMATMPQPADATEELRVWGRSHAEQAHDIFHFWNMPESMAEAVLSHHDHEGVAGYPPLARSVIYSTRWAELLHGGEPQPGQLVAFELALAAELGLDMAAMESFRSTCSDRFNRQLGVLGINRGAPEARLHEQSLSSIQSHYFLALGVLSEISPRSIRAVATAMQRQLRLFWGISIWDMQLRLPGAEQSSSIRCDGESLLIDAAAGNGRETDTTSGRLVLPIASGSVEYGHIAIPRELMPAGDGSLPLFAHMIGMCLEDYRRHIARAHSGAGLESLPFSVARLDAAGRVQEASPTFLDTFGLAETPVGTSAAALLEEQIGLGPSRFSASTLPENTGMIISVPEGRFPGTPLYLSHAAADPSSSFLFLGDISNLSSLQGFALGQAEALEALFDGIVERVCLLEEDGRIIWTDGSAKELLNRNIFMLAQPDTTLNEQWNPSFLAGLSGPVGVQALVSEDGKHVPYALTLAPTGKCDCRQYLLIMRSLSFEPLAPPDPTKGGQRDPLTGLYGYSQFHVLLNHLADLGQKHKAHVGIVFCSLDSLRDVNRARGVQEGDALLRQLTEGLMAACRPGRDYPCRYGTDKFAVLVSRATPLLMESLAENIHRFAREQVEKQVRVGLGLTMVSPGQAPRPRLDAAREASEGAFATDASYLWAE